MYTDLDHSPLQYQAICRLLSDLDLSKPEESLVIGAETIALLDTFSTPDWELFTRMAKAEGVAPLMHYAFSRSNYPLPSATRLQLQMAFYETAAFNQMLLTEMERVVQALNEANIPVIVLKGAVLATTIYPDPALRPMSDVDLLVKPEDLEQAKKLILSLGYYEPIPEMAKGVNRLTGHEYKLHNLAQPKISIELHWSVISGDYDRRTPSIDLLWNNRKTIVSQNEKYNHSIEILSLSPEYLLCYLIGHLIIQHGKSTGRLVWLFDIFTILKTNNDERFLTQFTEDISVLKWQAELKFSIELLSTHFGRKIPRFVIKNFNEQNQEDMKLIQSIWEENQDINDFYILQVRTLNKRKKLRLLMANVFPNEAYMRWRYKYKWQWQVLLYYPYRLWEISIKGFRTFAKNKVKN